MSKSDNIPWGPASTVDDVDESTQETASQGDAVQIDNVRPGTRSER
jgi:hypothetical protein